MTSTARRLIDAFLGGDAPSAAALLAPEATFHSPSETTPAPTESRVYGTRLRASSLTPAPHRSTSVTARRSPSSPARSKTSPSTGSCVRSPMTATTSLMVRPWAALKAGLADIKI